jgi:rRNA maturation endonuclease Nob1
LTIVLATGIVLAALYFTLGIRAKDVPEPEPVSPIQYLEDRKQAIYGNLRDLQFEYRLGKLSDEDYQQSKQALQRELAGVLAEMEAAAKRLGLSATRPVKQKVAKQQLATVCPHCKATFEQPLKFCGECGKPMS